MLSDVLTFQFMLAELIVSRGILWEKLQTVVGIQVVNVIEILANCWNQCFLECFVSNLPFIFWLPVASVKTLNVRSRDNYQEQRMPGDGCLWFCLQGSLSSVGNITLYIYLRHNNVNEKTSIFLFYLRRVEMFRWWVVKFL